MRTSFAEVIASEALAKSACELDSCVPVFLTLSSRRGDRRTEPLGPTVERRGMRRRRSSRRSIPCLSFDPPQPESATATRATITSPLPMCRLMGKSIRWQGASRSRWEVQCMYNMKDFALTG